MHLSLYFMSFLSCRFQKLSDDMHSKRKGSHIEILKCSAVHRVSNDGSLFRNSLGDNSEKIIVFFGAPSDLGPWIHILHSHMHRQLTAVSFAVSGRSWRELGGTAAWEIHFDYLFHSMHHLQTWYFLTRIKIGSRTYKVSQSRKGMTLTKTCSE